MVPGALQSAPVAAVSLVNDADAGDIQAAVTVGTEHGNPHYTVRLRHPIDALCCAVVSWRTAGGVFRLYSCELHRADGRGWRQTTLRAVRDTFGLNTR